MGRCSIFKRIQQKNWESPICGDWLNQLEQDVRDLGANTILIAHSLSCLLVAHWAAQTTLKIAGALLVAPPDPEAQVFPKEAHGFSDFPLRPFNLISTVVASENDPYADIEFSRSCANSWGSDFINIGMAGHINAASGLNDWPQGELILENLVNKMDA